MKNKNILIFGSGKHDDPDFYKKFITKDSIIISLNGGSNLLKKLNLKPNIMIGDLDSTKETKTNNKYDDFIIIKHPTDKDFSDFELASDYIIKNYKKADLFIFSMFGYRTDHFLFNIEVCKKLLKKNYFPIMYSQNEEIYFIQNKYNLKLTCNINDLISILPISTKAYISETIGLKYKLTNEPIYSKTTRGLSNIATSDSIEINLISGQLMIIRTINDKQ